MLPAIFVLNSGGVTKAGRRTAMAICGGGGNAAEVIHSTQYGVDKQNLSLGGFAE
jgi:hypothetical protein